MKNRKFGIGVWDKGNWYARGTVMFLIEWKKEENMLSIDDSLAIGHRLKLNEDFFDHVYSGADTAFSDSNDNYELSLFFIASANTICMSIFCKNLSAKKILEELLDEIKNLKEGETLKYN